MSDSSKIGPAVKFPIHVPLDTSHVGHPDDRNIEEGARQDSGEAANLNEQKETSFPTLWSEFGQTMLESAKKDPYAKKAAEWVEKSPKEAVKLLEGLSSDEALNLTLAAMAPILAGKNASKAANWLAGLKADYAAKILKAMKLGDAGNIMAKMEPAAGAKILVVMKPVDAAKILVKVDPGVVDKLMAAMKLDNKTEIAMAMGPAEVAKMLIRTTDNNDAVMFLCNIQRLNPRNGYKFLEALMDLKRGRAVELLAATKIDSGDLDRFCQMFVEMSHTGKIEKVAQLLLAVPEDKRTAALRVIRGKESSLAKLLEDRIPPPKG